MRYLQTILSATSLLMTIGCSDSPSSTGTSTQEQEAGTSDSVESLPDKLFGSWTTDCASEGDGFSHELTEWNFTSTEITIKALTFDPTDASCTGSNEKTEFTYEAAYLSEFEDTQFGRAIMTDMTITRLVMENESGETLIDSDIDGIPADANNQFQIFLVESELLYGGDLSSGDASTTETRPTEIDSSYGLSRKL